MLLTQAACTGKLTAICCVQWFSLGLITLHVHMCIPTSVWWNLFFEVLRPLKSFVCNVLFVIQFICRWIEKWKEVGASSCLCNNRFPIPIATCKDSLLLFSISLCSVLLMYCQFNQCFIQYEQSVPKMTLDWLDCQIFKHKDKG